MNILRDARFGIRTLIRSRGFTAVVVLTLAVGIGASTAIFSVVNAVVLRPLEYPEPERLVRITSELTRFGATDTGVAAAEMADYQSRTDLFAAVAGVLPISANVASAAGPERVDMLLVSWNYFDVLGAAPALGRGFAREDDVPNVANIAVVSDGFWRRRLGADPRAIDQTIMIDEDPIRVVGVMPAGFGHPGRTLQNEVDVWSPAGFRAGSGPPNRSRRRLEGCLARLRPDVALDHAQAALAQYGLAMSQQFPSDYPPENGWRPRVVPLQDDVVGGVATAMYVLLSGVGLLLLVACVNVAHLVLARSTARRQEMAIRTALGASGGRLRWQLAVESVLLAAAGGALALLVASWALSGLVALAPARLPRLENVSLDFTAVLVAALISLCVTVLFAFAPSSHMRRADTFAELKAGGPGRSSDGRSSRTRGVLVAAEVAMATVLLIGAGLFVRTVIQLLNVPIGFETDHLLTARLTLPRPNDAARAAYLDPARRVAFYRETLRRVGSLPGVEHAAMSTQIPMGGFNPPFFVEIDGRATDDRSVRPVMHNFQVSSGYFTTLGIRILAGRSFNDFDRAGALPVAIVSQAAVRAFWQGRDPLGARVRLRSDGPWITIVGIADDVISRRLTEPAQPILYQSLEQSSDLTLALLLRTRSDSASLRDGIAREVRAVDPDVPIYAVRTMKDWLDAAVAQRRFLMRLLVTFGALATALALLGIYGVMAYSVSQRTREIGIRIAIGARQSDVSLMVLRRGMLLAGTGVAAGVVASLALSRLVRSQLFGVQPSDPLTFVSVLILMTVVAAAAAYLPARRAARVDPIAALRSY
jgi:putative ABC transport system permease protein